MQEKGIAKNDNAKGQKYIADSFSFSENDE
jgi:hypothetical protein